MTVCLISLGAIQKPFCNPEELAALAIVVTSSSDVDLPFKRVDAWKTADWMTLRAVSLSTHYLCPKDLFSCLEESVGETLAEMAVSGALRSRPTAL